jgi:hypothetical protein
MLTPFAPGTREPTLHPAGRAFERLVRRRDRKRRNQRIAAGVVGMAVFVAAVWIVTSGLSVDRLQTSVVPGGDVTGPRDRTDGPARNRTGGVHRPASRGAAPQHPEPGELVLEFGGEPLQRYVDLYVDVRGRTADRRQFATNVPMVRTVIGGRSSRAATDPGGPGSRAFGGHFDRAVR